MGPGDAPRDSHLCRGLRLFSAYGGSDPCPGGNQEIPRGGRLYLVGENPPLRSAFHSDGRGFIPLPLHQCPDFVFKAAEGDDRGRQNSRARTVLCLLHGGASPGEAGHRCGTESDFDGSGQRLRGGALFRRADFNGRHFSNLVWTGRPLVCAASRRACHARGSICPAH